MIGPDRHSEIVPCCVATLSIQTRVSELPMRLFTVLATLLFSYCFVAVTRAEAAPCETGQVICPRGSNCVANVGCVRQNTTTCRCPARACAWPEECNCQGACALKLCSATSGCGKRVNPDNACEITTCKQGKCVSVPLLCDNCDPKTGCKLGPRDTVSSTTTNTNTGSTGTNTAKGVTTQEVYTADWPTHKRNVLIGFGCLLGGAGLVFAGVAVYFAVTGRWRS